MRVHVTFSDGFAEIQDLPEASPAAKLLLVKRSKFSRKGVACVRVGWLEDGTPKFAEDSSLIPAGGWAGGYGTDYYAGGLLV